MAGKKTVTNAGEAAAKAGRGAAKAPGLSAKDRNAATFADLSPEGKAAMRTMADKLGLDAVAAHELHTKIIPELEAAGVGNKQIKAIFSAEDPYVAGKQLLVDERGALTDGILKSGQPYDAQTLEGFSLRELKDTLNQINKGGSKPRPSGIRGKDPEASQTVETRLPGDDQSASTGGKSEEQPATGSKQEKDALRAFLARGSEVFSDGQPATGEGFFRENVFGPAGDFRSVATPGGGIQRPTMIDVQPAPPRTPTMAEIEAAARGVTPPKSPKVKPQRVSSLAAMDLDPSMTQVNVGDVSAAPQSGGPIVVGSQFDNGMPAGVVDATQMRRPASPSVQPAPPVEVAPKPPETPPGPPVSQTDPLVRSVMGVARSIPKAPVSWGAAAAATLGGAYGLGWRPFGTQPSQQPANQPPAEPVQILSPEAVRQIEQGGMRPAPRQPGANQSTDIIRQLVGRMA